MTDVEKVVTPERVAAQAHAKVDRARAARIEPRRIVLIALIVLASAFVAWKFIDWLFLPSAQASFAISARTGSVIVGVPCGQRLLWDLPAGRVMSRSAVPGSAASGEGKATLTLEGGSRAQVELTGPKLLTVTVEHIDGFSGGCRSASPSFSMSLGENNLAYDPRGFRYVATASIDRDAPMSLSLPVVGHVVLGQPVQHGAGWSARPTGILEGGTIMLRVVPWGSEERVTLEAEELDPGSQLDTHSCLMEARNAAASACPSPADPPAIGFLRLLPTGTIAVQLYARGPVGLLPFGSLEQRKLTVPNSTAGWRSERVHVYGGFVILLAALLGLIPKMKEVYDFFRGLAQGKPSGRANDPSSSGDELTDAALDAATARPARSKKPNTEVAAVVAVALLSAHCAVEVPTALAEPVEVRQDSLIGAGYSFRRGNACYVVTALHVVPEIGVPITVFDRSGARTDASRSYQNESYDLALVTLPDKHQVACTATWPDVGWLRRASFPASSEFRAVRHYSGGKEVIVRLKHAGGDKDRLTLAPVDKLTIRESDSGTMVEVDGKLAGIVQSVDTATDYVSVLRLDRIDQLVGDRFRSSSSARAVKFAGVTWRGRENPTWSSYVQAWIAEKVTPTVITPSQSAGTAAFNCEIKVDVLSWERVAVPNPAFDGVQLQLKACGKKGFLYEQMCNAARTTQSTTPRQLQSQKITLNATVIPTGATPISRLTTSTHVPQSNTLGHTEIELGSLQAAVGMTLPEMLKGGACN